jgi:hypothetical protein
MRDRLIFGAAWIAMGFCGCCCDSGPPPGISDTTIVVDADDGYDNMGTGTSVSPFQTITRGLQFANDGDKVQVEPGTYDATLGEVFPIVIPNGVTLIGDVAFSDGIAVIAGHGAWTSTAAGVSVDVAVVATERSRIEGMGVTASEGTAIWAEGATGAVIKTNALADSTAGIEVAGADPLVAFNEVSGSEYGLAVLAGATPHVRNNTFTANGIGIWIGPGTTPDLGTALDPGGNVLHSNTECDLENASATTVDAIGNAWDADPFLFTAATTCTEGTNVANTNAGAVRFQDIPAGDSSLFAGTALLAISAPARGDTVPTPQPRLVWTPSGSRFAMVAISTEPLKVRERRIANPDVIVWAWHSGLPAGNEGDVAFADGTAVINGNISQSAPIALERGRTYYWAAWAWDATALQVSSSTAVGYFIVSH